MAELKFDISKVVEGAIKEFKHQGYNVSKWISVDEALPENENECVIDTQMALYYKIGQKIEIEKQEKTILEEPPVAEEKQIIENIIRVTMTKLMIFFAM